MKESVAHLVLEHLLEIRASMAKVADELRLMRAEMAAFPHATYQHHARGTELQQDAHHEDIASLKVRVDRIEK